ncbi:MAG: hypothetical protein K2N12_00695 [Helicobacter sp.]|nr:hypothetical protein [Helicobacter sp.]
MLIIVEGKYDVGFLDIYLQYLGVGVKDYKFHEVGGNKNLENQLNKEVETDEDKKENLREKINKALKEGKKIKIIFDRDDNYESSLQNIKKQLDNDLLPKCEIFLIPNNQDEGNLEDLFFRIVKEKDILKCLRRSRECIEKIDSEIPNFEPPDKKAVVYAYAHMFGGAIKDGRIKLKGNILDILDLNNEYLQPLKNFLLDIKD